MNPFDSTAFWTALVAGLMTVAGFLAQRLPRRNQQAQADMTLGAGWSEFAAALREEAQEERALRHVVEQDAIDCKNRVAVLEKKCAAFERHLDNLGLPLPPEQP